MAGSKFNTKSPSIKRILREAQELASSPSADYHAAPLETDLFEWHFTLRGPPEPSPYARGIYHGRITLKPEYPLRPPSFRFLSPSGRFEVNREICLSISNYHEETWQPAWGIRTALVAIRSFMDSEAAGQVGGLECSEDVRRRLAEQSRTWCCDSCLGDDHTHAKSNEQRMAECEAAAKEYEAREGQRKEEEVPSELKFAYKDELGQKDGSREVNSAPSTSSTTAAAAVPSVDASSPADSASVQLQPPQHTVPANVVAPAVLNPPRSQASIYLDGFIAALAVAFISLMMKKLANRSSAVSTDTYDFA